MGLQLKIANSKNKNLVGIEGKIVDETKNMFTIETKDGEKKITKDQCVFEIALTKNETVIIDGSLLNGKPEKRIKKTKTKKRV